MHADTINRWKTGFAIQQAKTEGKWKERWITGPGKRIEKTWEHVSDCDSNCDWCFRYSHQRNGT